MRRWRALSTAARSCRASFSFDRYGLVTLTLRKFLDPADLRKPNSLMTLLSHFSRRIGRAYGAVFLGALSLHAQFVAFNDHAPGAGTAPNVTTWNIDGASPGSSGALVDIDSGATLSVQLTISHSGSIFEGGSAGNPDPNTPLYNVFNGYVDFMGAGDADAVVQVPS